MSLTKISKRGVSSIQENWRVFGVVKKGFASNIKTVKVSEEKHHKKWVKSQYQRNHSVNFFHC